VLIVGSSYNADCSRLPRDDSRYVNSSPMISRHSFVNKVDGNSRREWRVVQGMDTMPKWSSASDSMPLQLPVQESLPPLILSMHSQPASIPVAAAG